MVNPVGTVFPHRSKINGYPQISVGELHPQRDRKAVLREIINDLKPVFDKAHRCTVFIHAAGAGGDGIHPLNLGIGVADHEVGKQFHFRLAFGHLILVCGRRVAVPGIAGGGADHLKGTEKILGGSVGIQRQTAVLGHQGIFRRLPVRGREDIAPNHILCSCCFIRFGDHRYRRQQKQKRGKAAEQFDTAAELHRASPFFCGFFRHRLTARRTTPYKNTAIISRHSHGTSTRSTLFRTILYALP